MSENNRKLVFRLSSVRKVIEDNNASGTDALWLSDPSTLKNIYQPVAAPPAGLIKQQSRTFKIMSVSKPYYRLYRPGLNRDTFNNQSKGYERDALFLPEAERKSMIKAARLIIDDFERLFEYIEPHTSNENVFSHRIYELLLRTCTEVESCCKGILIANGHAANNMDDYKKIEQSSHLSGYTVEYSNWLPVKYVTQPFANWATGASLPWYKAYNDVKHNRCQNFSKASLKNLLDAICGLLCIIHTQIGDGVQFVFESNIYLSAEDSDVDVRSFKIKPYQIPDAEKYDFVWEDIKADPSRFQQFQYV